MRIAQGQIAPTFTATTFQGDTIAIEEFRGKKVWLGFYRWASCPLCNLRIKEVIERAGEFEEAGIQHIAVFQSPPQKIDKHVGKQNPPFPVIADPDLALYTKYHVQNSWLGLFYPRVMIRAMRALFSGFFSLDVDGHLARIPADFLVDPEGLVWKAYYGQAASDHIPFDDIKAFERDRCLDMPEEVVL